MTTWKRKILMATVAILITSAAAAFGNRSWAADVGENTVSNGRDYHISLIEAARPEDPVIHRSPETEKKIQENRDSSLKGRKGKGPVYERRESKDSFMNASMKKDDHRKWKHHMDKDDRYDGRYEKHHKKEHRFYKDDDRHMDRDEHHDNRFERHHKKYKKDHRFYKDGDRHMGRDDHDRYEKHHKKYKKGHHSYKKGDKKRQQYREDHSEKAVF